MPKLRITLISDTHTKHEQVELPGGDILLHAGDIMNSGYSHSDIDSFCRWFGKQDYDLLAFIAGNHDRLFENKPVEAMEMVDSYGWIDYLKDDTLLFEKNVDGQDLGLKIYGTPWQPEFYNWAFNLPRSGKELKEKWAEIPEGTDILITHGPPQGILDTSGPPYNEPLLGCELLTERVKEIKPKIHVFGHIHGGYGYEFIDGTHFFNASVLNERYEHTNKPFTFDFDPISNTVDFID
jgi:predicted phosphodiesterase